MQEFVPAGQKVNLLVWRTICGGVFIAGAMIFLSPAEYVCRQIAKRFRGMIEDGIEERYVRADEAEEICKYCRTFYTRDDHVINCSSLKDFLQANPNTAKIFSRDGQFVGLYIIFAINRAATRKLLDQSFTSAQQLNNRHAVRKWRYATGLYVTNISVKGFRNRGYILKQLRQDIAHLVGSNRSIEYVFARMANEDGARIIRKYKFSKIDKERPDENQIWMYKVEPSLPAGLLS